MQQSQALLQEYDSEITIRNKDTKQETEPTRKEFALNKMPQEIINHVAEHLSEEDTFSLRSTSRRFYGQDPTVGCPYALRYSRGAGFFVCDKVYHFLAGKDDEPLCHNVVLDACYLIPVVLCSCTIALPACCLGGIVGCLVDTKNKIKRELRPALEEEFISLGPAQEKMRDV